MGPGVHVRQLFLLHKGQGAVSTPGHLTCAAALNHNCIEESNGQTGWSKIQKPRGPTLPQKPDKNTRETSNAVQAGPDTGQVHAEEARCRLPGNGRSEDHVQGYV